jgi:CMP-2-keto-3-deoxyoctulosonic acid synthetase
MAVYMKIIISERSYFMKTAVIIPSRYSSPPFAAKPLARIAGKSIIRRYYEAAKQTENITDAPALHISRSPVPFGREPGQEYDAYKHRGVYACPSGEPDIFRRLPLGKPEDIEKPERLRALEYGNKIRVPVTVCDSPEVNLSESTGPITTLLQRRRKR